MIPVDAAFLERIELFEDMLKKIAPQNHEKYIEVRGWIQSFYLMGWQDAKKHSETELKKG